MLMKWHKHLSDTTITIGIKVAFDKVNFFQIDNSLDLICNFTTDEVVNHHLASRWFTCFVLIQNFFKMMDQGATRFFARSGIDDSSWLFSSEVSLDIQNTKILNQRPRLGVTNNKLAIKSQIPFNSREFGPGKFHNHTSLIVLFLYRKYHKIY
jgi:hypothetical protein